MSHELHIKDAEAEQLLIEFTHLQPPSRAAALAMVGAHTVVPATNEWGHPANYAMPLCIPGDTGAETFLNKINLLAPKGSGPRCWNVDRVTRNARTVMSPAVHTDIPKLLRQIANHVATSDIDATIPRSIQKAHAKNGTNMEYRPDRRSLTDAATTVAHKRIQQLLAVADMDLCYGIQFQENGARVIDASWAPSELMQFIDGVVPNGKLHHFATLEEMLATLPFQGVHCGILLGALVNDSYHVDRSDDAIRVAFQLNSHLLHSMQRSIDN